VNSESPSRVILINFSDSVELKALEFPIIAVRSSGSECGLDKLSNDTLQKCIE
jgi:hypothetical protein